MARIALKISYDGTNYNGWQKQIEPQNVCTLQDTIEAVAKKLFKQELKLYAAGRTDAGVHAYSQVAHFDVQTAMPIEKMSAALNGLLSNDIRIIGVAEVDSSFHARFSPHSKTYRYTVDTARVQNVFHRLYTAHYPRELDLQLMQKCLHDLIGEHDFEAFCAANSGRQNFVRTISEAKLWQDEQLYILELTGNGFLYNMVRIIVGSLMEIGSGKLAPDILRKALISKKRSDLGVTFGPEGLSLWQLAYAEEINWKS
ncbi:MAG: tRNA pseudouridine(38-40) synthase TruA [Clostridia bacterium]